MHILSPASEKNNKPENIDPMENLSSVLDESIKLG